jgi:hypothetical protein
VHESLKEVITMSVDNELQAEVQALRTERDKLAAKNRELLAEGRALKDQVTTLTTTTTEQGARLRRYELDGPVEHAITEAALPECAQAWRTLFESAFEFRVGEAGRVEIVSRATGEPASLPARPGTRGRERERPAQLERADLIELTSQVPGMDRITQATSRGSGSGATGSHAGGALGPESRRNQPGKGAETPPIAPLGLR